MHEVPPPLLRVRHQPSGASHQQRLGTKPAVFENPLKVINCFRSDAGAGFFADVRSVIETGRRQGLTALDAISRTLNGETLFAS